MNSRTIIYETEHFYVLSPNPPHIPRADGGHLCINGKTDVESRTDLSPKLATEVMRLTMLIGEAMQRGMKNRGVDIGRINYQDNGNWAFQNGGNKSVFHIHLYGRTRDAKTQTWGEALVFPNKATGFYDAFEPFNDGDLQEIQAQISRLEQEEKYKPENWNL